MIALTRDLGNPLTFQGYQHGIGVWTDRKQNQSYFYCSYDEWNPSPLHSVVFRVKINEQSVGKWEFVGKLDFNSKYATTSPCGKYFWSLEFSTSNFNRQVARELLTFRQIDPKTLEYESFQMTGLILEYFSLYILILGLDPQTLGTSLDTVRFQFTQNWGVFLIVQCRDRSNDELYKDKDAIFRFHINEVIFQL